MSSPADIRRRALDLVEQLPPEQLTVVVQLMEFLAQSGQQDTTQLEENHLLQIIQRRFSPDQQRRLEELRDRSEWETLSETEHQELIHLEDLLEQQRVERLEALMNLAKLRDVDLLTLNRQLLPEPSPFHAV